jgi:hypothetical protein
MSARLSKQLSQFHDSLKELASSFGAEVLGYTKTGSGHTAFILRLGSIERKFFCPTSPSDSRWSKNGLTMARKLLIGMTKLPA